MKGDRISQAIARIEAAADRINAASENLGPNDSTSHEIERKHEALRKEVSQTLSDLDKLIEGLAP